MYTEESPRRRRFPNSLPLLLLLEDLEVPSRTSWIQGSIHRVGSTAPPDGGLFLPCRSRRRHSNAPHSLGDQPSAAFKHFGGPRNYRPPVPCWWSVERGDNTWPGAGLRFGAITRACGEPLVNLFASRASYVFNYLAGGPVRSCDLCPGSSDEGKEPGKTGERSRLRSVSRVATEKKLLPLRWGDCSASDRSRVR